MPWLDKSLPLPTGIADDVSRLDKSKLFGDKSITAPWLGKLPLVVGDREDTPGSDKFLSDAMEMGRSISWSGESCFDVGDMADKIFWLGETLSDDGGNIEETPPLLKSVSDDGGQACTRTFGKSLHRWVTVFICV